MSTNRVRMTPPPHTAGIFVLKPPFSASSSIVYTVDAIETLKELRADKVDIFTRYYKPKGLTENDYTVDAGSHASIITLRAGDGSVIEVPDTYIVSYPGDSGLDHTRRVLICDLGLIPEYMNVDYITGDVEDVIKQNIGVVSAVSLAVGPVRTKLTYAQHVESERQRRVNVATYESNSEVINRLTAENTTLKDRCEQLEKIIIAMNETKK